MKNNDYLLSKVSVLALGCVMPMLSQAQTDAAIGQLEEITITAERRSVDLQKAALSIVAIDGSTLESRGDSNVAQVLRNVPGITIEAGGTGPGVPGAGGPPRVSIRGVGTDGPNKSSATAFYEDGVFLTGGGAYFHDIERVEVLRGPQGTLYGRAATAGAVNLITNKPSQKSEATAAIELGSYNLQHVSAMANQPLSDSLAVRVSFNSNERDAIFNNGYGKVDDTNTRVKLLYKPSEKFSLLLGGVYYRANGTSSASVDLPTQASKPIDWITSSLPNPINSNVYKRGFAELNWNVGFGTVTYLPSYTTNEAKTIVYGGMSAALRTTLTLPNDHSQSHELRIASNDNSALSWIGGVYYYKNKYDQGLYNELPNTDGTFSPGGGPTRAQFFDLESKALFGELTFAATDSLRFVGGVRESYDEVHHIDHQVGRANPPGEDIPTNKKYRHFDWKLRGEMDLSVNNLVYGSASTGYRPGGAVNGTPYAQEIVTAFELGSKNRIGNRVIANVSGFYYDYAGFQAPQNWCNPDPSVACPPFITRIMSADATFYGAEAELTAQLTNNDRLTISPSYIVAKFTEDLNATSPFNGDQYRIYTNGKVAPHSPKLTASVDYQHRFGLQNGAAITAQADARYSSEYIVAFDAAGYGALNLATGEATTVDRRLTQESYLVSNASLMFTSATGRYNLTAYGKNLANKIYVIGLGGPLNSADVNDPRTFGLLFSARFQ